MTSLNSMHWVQPEWSHSISIYQQSFVMALWRYYDWYSKLLVGVRWGTALSEVAVVSCGVRQGGVISPVLFNVSINVFYKSITFTTNWMSCKWFILGMFVLCGRCVMLLCPSVTGLQYMLDVCVASADTLSLKFSPLKSHCLAIGKFASVSLPSMQLDSHPIPWASSIKHLWVYIINGRKLLFDVTSVKQSFLLPVTLFMLRLRVLMIRCVYPSRRAIGPISYIRISLCYFCFRWQGICCLQIYNRLI